MPNIHQPGIEPSEAVYAYARHFGEHVDWPPREDSVIANALFHVNGHSINNLPNKLTSFDGSPVFVDHVMFSAITFNAFATRCRDRYLAVLYGGAYLNCLDTAFTIFHARNAAQPRRPFGGKATIGN